MEFPLLHELLALPLYELSQSEKEVQLFGAMREVTQFHFDHCEHYRKLCMARDVNPNNLSRLDDFIYLPTSFFKRNLLISVPEEKVVREVRSSATTSGVSSRMGLDRQTSRRQSKCFTKTIVNRIGNERRRFVVLDEPSTIENSEVVTARSSTIKSLLFLSNGTEAVLDQNEDGTLELHPERFCAALESVCARSKPAIVFGFTYVLYAFVVRRLKDEGKSFQLPAGSKILHIGGWKKLEEEKVTPEELVRDCADVFGVGLGDVVDLYGFTEQAGLIYPTCEYGQRHCPEWADIIVRDPITLESLPPGNEGLLEFLTPIQTSYPGHCVLTEDVGLITGVDDCPCGRKGRSFKLLGRAPDAEVRGCGDIMAAKFG